VPAAAATLAYSLAVERGPTAAQPAGPLVAGSGPPRVVPTARASRRSADAPAARAEPAAPGPAGAKATSVTTPAELFREADRALAAGDRDSARTALLAIVRDRPADTVADAARIDLATLALQAGELNSARRYLDDVRGEAVAEPAARLRCRVEVAAHDPQAAGCLAAFRRRFPGSPYDVEMMLEEAVLRADEGDCARAAAARSGAGGHSLRRPARRRACPPGPLRRQALSRPERSRAPGVREARGFLLTK